MTPSSMFLLEALVIVAVPVVLLRISGLKGLLPLVVVQILVGIALGPSIFGRIAPDYFHIFASPEKLASFSGIAFVAVLIFGMISGLHLDLGIFNGNERGFWAIAAASIVVPMTLGLLAGALILARHPDELLPGIAPLEFMVGIGISVSMNALPVLAAILGEMGLLGSRLGRLALGVAGVNNLVLWIVLGILLAAASGHSGGGHALTPIYVFILAPLYVILMVRIVRPVLGNMIMVRMPEEVVNTRALVLVGAATIASALATEIMALHYIIGAFLVGAIMPTKLHQPILDRLQVVTVALLMPFFFTLTRMRTLIDLNSPALLEVFLVTAAAGVAGIVGGTASAARIFGETWPVAVGLGSLLQSKGLTELIVLTVLLEAHIISPIIFSAMILVAVFSTACAMPLARLTLAHAPGARRMVGNRVAPVPGEQV
jgi:Kef-type K+ transport system membrane component KefB